MSRAGFLCLHLGVIKQKSRVLEPPKAQQVRGPEPLCKLGGQQHSSGKSKAEHEDIGSQA